MIEGNDIICFSNDWNGDPLSKKHIATRLARKNRILWVNSIGNRNPAVSAHDLRRALKKLLQCCQGLRRVAGNIWVLAPLVIPFHGSRAARRVNRRLLRWRVEQACRTLGFQQPITWTFVPSSADVAGSLGERLLVYHCVDEFSQFTGTNRGAILEMERRLLTRADAVIVSSAKLYESKRAYNPNTFLVRHGVDLEHFRKACLDTTREPEECRRLRRPIIGFFGLIADWVDLQTIRHIALARAQWSFVLIGKVQTDTSPLRGLPNVHLLGRRDYESLPAYCKAFDVAILPFIVNELTVAANPLKLREYLAAGLPVVATPLPEVETLGGRVRVARSPQEFLTQIEDLLRERQGSRLAVSKSMESESWDQKVEELSRVVADCLATPNREAERLRAAGAVPAA
ncbi:MAG TPA: glycosyltransferase [Bryobacterales bacterium]|nr:glycosyltransferase [Bryobacterales bacterium]